MIDSNQDEAVKLEARRLLAAEMADADAAVLVSPGGLYDLDCRVPAEEALRAVVNALTRTTPANLNAPDKQEALAGEGVEGGCSDEALSLARPIVEADLEVAKESGDQDWIAQSLSALDAIDGALSRTLPSNEALGDDRNGVEGRARELLAHLRSMPMTEWVWADAERIFATLSRTPSSPQADEADVERVAAVIRPLITGGSTFSEDERDEMAVDMARAAIATMTTRPAGPIPMLLFCPKCGLKHVDEPDPDGATSVEISGRESRWDNPPHRSHLCHNPDCRTIWRPADVPTNGVARIETTGKADTINLNELPSLTRPAGGEEVERDPAYDYAVSLLRTLHGKHFPDQTGLQMLPDTLGVLTQIDNLTTALTKPAALPKGDAASVLDAVGHEHNADGATADQVERASAAVAANLENGTPKHGSAQGYACALTAIMQTDAALPKGEDIDQLVQDARVAACGTRLTCREREVIRALCDAVVARAALPKEGGEAFLKDLRLEIASLCREPSGKIDMAVHKIDARLNALSSLPVRSGEMERLRTLLVTLEDAESFYRAQHDQYGDGSAKAGRAWDLMRRAGDNARAALAPPPQGQEKGEVGR